MSLTSIRKNSFKDAQEFEELLNKADKLGVNLSAGNFDKWLKSMAEFFNIGEVQKQFLFLRWKCFEERTDEAPQKVNETFSNEEGVSLI